MTVLDDQIIAWEAAEADLRRKVGAYLRAKRTATGLPLRVVAESTGLSIRLVSLAERGRSASINTLVRLLGHYGSSLGIYGPPFTPTIHFDPDQIAAAAWTRGIVVDLLPTEGSET